MLILTLRTDKPEAEIGLYKEAKELSYVTWHAHRELAETLHIKIDQLLAGVNVAKAGLGGIVGFQGPGSFTGLRIGLSVANTLAYALGIPIVGAKGERWRQGGIDRLRGGESDTVVLPEYGGDVHITTPKK